MLLRSVRARMTLWSVGVVALALVLFSLTLRVTVQRFLMTAVDRDLRERAHGPAMGGPGGPGGPGGREFGMRPPEMRDGDGPPPEAQGQRLPPGVGIGAQAGIPRDGFGPRMGIAGGANGQGVPGGFEGRRGNRSGGPRPDFRPGPPMSDGPDGPPDSEDAPLRPRFGIPPVFIDRSGHDLATHQATFILSEEGFRNALKGPPVFTDGMLGEEPIRVLSQAIWRDGQQVGVIQVAAPLGETRRALAGMTRTMILLMPAALLLAGLGGAFLTERALRPVRAITEAARNIGANNLKDRLPVRGGDEFARLAEMLNGMLSRIEDAFARQKRFTADASHELKTPLSIIKVSSSMALEEELTPEEYRQSLKSIDRATDRANRVVQDLLLLARSNSGTLPLHPVTLPVEEVIHDAQDALPATTGATITTDIAPGLVIHADRHHIARLLTNLLENARRHTPPDGHIEVAAHRDGAFAEIIVADTGEGIAAEHLPHIGEPFYRVDAARTRDKGGTGLGLAICRTITQAHGGTLTVDSVVGEGTTVRVHLPLAGRAASVDDMPSPSFATGVRGR